MLRAFVPAAVLSVTLLGTALAQQGAPVSEEQSRQIADAVAKETEAAWNSGNAAGVANQFSDDGFWSTGAGRVLSGRRVIEQAVMARLQAGYTEQTVKVLQAHPAGDLIWCFGEYTLTGKGEASAKPLHGQFAQLLTSQGNEPRIRMMVSNITLTLPGTQPAANAPSAAPPR